MKKHFIIFSVLASLIGFSIFPHLSSNAFAEEKLDISSKSAYLMDYGTGECLYAKNENEKMPIASVCKVMTLCLLFDAVDENKLSLTDEVVVSSKASGMGGSQVFLDANKSYSVGDLAKSIIVCSANDSSVAIAETIAGSEETFVSLMNDTAKKWGCNNTLFSNCTGLPKPTQYSSAKDVAIMFKHLISHDEYFNYSKIWYEDFVHPDKRVTVITNTNKLIKRYSHCDGGKTGFTNEAGFCFVSTAQKNNLRLISSVLGSGSSDDRFNSTINLFNYGFANFRNKIIIDKDIPLNDNFICGNANKGDYVVYPERNCYLLSKADGQTEDITYQINDMKVKAPIKKGQQVGSIEIYKNSILYDTVNVISGEDVEKAKFGDNFKKISENW